MNRRPLFVLVGLIVLLGAGFAGLWFLTQKTPVVPIERSEVLAHPEPAAAPPGQASAVEAASETSAPERKLVQKTAADKAAASAPTAPVEAELKGGLWIEGKVKFPDGTPPDEKIEVEARGKKFPSGTWHTATVQRDGSFRVAFGPGTRTGWLRLQGRYCYLAEDQRVRFPSKPGAKLDPVELAPVLGGLIRGHVTLPLGVSSKETGLAGTRVQAWRTSFSPGDDSGVLRSRTGEIGADERFELGGVPSKSGWMVTLDPEAFTRTQKGDIKVEAGKSIDLEFPLKLGARLSGMVVDEQGAAVAEAQFRYEAPEAPDGTGWTNYRGKKSEADGSFDLRGTPTGKGKLTVEKEGYLTETLEYASLAEGSTQPGLRVVLRRGESIAGNVKWPGGEPAAGAMVYMRFAPEDQKDSQQFGWFGGNERSTKCDSEGKFTFSGLTRGTATLRADSKPPAEMLAADKKAVEASAKPDGDSEEDASAAEEHAASKSASKSQRQRKWTAVAEDVRAGTQAVVLVLDAGFSIQGRVLDSKGGPIENFMVRAEPVDHERQPWEPARGTVTGRFSDAGGRFTLEGLHEGEWQLRAEAKDAPACAPKQVKVPEESGPVVLTLAAACTISGIVVDPKGLPAHGVHVQAEPEQDETRGLVFNSNKRFSSTTGSEGTFEITGVPPGPITLQATCDEWAAAAPLKLEIAPGQKLENTKLVMRAPGRIVGVVLDNLGHIDAGRPISLNGENTSWEQTTSDAQGRFSFEKLAPGDYQLNTQAKQEEYADAGSDQNRMNRVWQEQQRNLKATVTEGGTTEVTLGGPPKNAIHLVGHVTCGGRPVADAYLQAWGRASSDDNEPRNFHAASAEDGSYDLVVGGAGDYQVNINGPGAGGGTSIHFSVKIGADPRQSRDFELPGARIAGRLVDRQGKPLSGIWMQLGADPRVRGQGGRNVSGNVSTDEEGRFQFEHIGPGTYQIVCGGNDGGWRSSPRTGRTTVPGLVVEEGKSLEGLEIVAQPPCRVEGRVTGPDGAPVVGAIVLAADEQGQSVVGWRRETTDATGNFSFDAIPPGRVSFLAEKGSLTSGYSSLVTVQENETTKCDLALSNGATVFLDTVDAEGAHVKCDLQVFDVRGLDVTSVGNWVRSEQEVPHPGRRVGPLLPGKYSLVVMRKDKPDLRQELSVGSEPVQDVSVRCD